MLVIYRVMLWKNTTQMYVVNAKYDKKYFDQFNWSYLPILGLYLDLNKFYFVKMRFYTNLQFLEKLVVLCIKFHKMKLWFLIFKIIKNIVLFWIQDATLNDLVNTLGAQHSMQHSYIIIMSQWTVSNLGRGLEVLCKGKSCLKNIHYYGLFWN